MGGSSEEVACLQSQGTCQWLEKGRFRCSWYHQAKLRTLHEVVVRNRLEQLRKRQRDAALQAQEELLAGVAKSAQRGEARVIPADVVAEQDAAEQVEPYDRSMSPPLIDIRKLHHEERQIDILTTLEDLRYLVCPRPIGSHTMIVILTLSLVAATPQRSRYSVHTQDCPGGTRATGCRGA